MPETGTETTVADVNTNTENNGNNGTSTQATLDSQDKNVPLHTYIGEKKKRQELEEKLRLVEVEKKSAEEAKLIEDGKLQELINAKSLELTTIQELLKTANARAEESDKFKAAKVEEYKKLLGDKWLDDYASLSLTALDSLAKSMLPKTVIHTDGGATGQHLSIELTPEQKREAYGMYPHLSKEKAEEYLKHNLIKSGKIKEK